MSLKTKKIPDFSIIIPTYNRSSFVKLAVLSALQQKGVSIEVIVIDDCSTDNTKETIKAIRDKRVKYIKNVKRIGYALNVQKCFRYSIGDYIFTLGDDDFILDENTLSEVLKVMKKYKLGLARLGAILYETSPKLPHRVLNLSDKLVVIKPKGKENIISQMLPFGLGNYTGLVFNNKLIDKSKFINHMNLVYFPVAFDVIQKYGFAYIPKYFLVTHLSFQMIPTYWNPDKLGSFFIEDHLKIVEEYINDKDYKGYKNKYIFGELRMLPNIKYFTDNKNFVRILKRIICLDKTILLHPQFYAYSAAGFLPKIIIKGMRRLVYLMSNNTKEILNNDYFQKIERLNSYNIP